MKETTTFTWTALSLTFLTLYTTCHGQPQSRFISRPGSTYYISRGKSVMLECEAEMVDDLKFICSEVIPENRMMVVGRISESGRELLKASVEITRDDIKGFTDRNSFWCECRGRHFETGRVIRTRRSEIFPSYLRKVFVEEPRSKAAPLGSKVELNCSPPEGQPTPTISWLKDGRRLHVDRDKNYEIDGRGMLVIKRFRSQDVGSYVCIARNSASKRTSAAAMLSIGESSENERLEASDSPIPDEPIYEKQPERLYYVTEEDPVEIPCKVVGAQILTVRCNNRRLNDNEQRKSEFKGEDGGTVYETVFTVKAEDVRKYRDSNNSYSCICMSWYTKPSVQGWLNKKSDKGYIEVAFLEEEFVKEPESQMARIDDSVTFNCKPPTSKPPADVTWYFNGKEIDVNSGYFVVDEEEGSLIIESLTSENFGDYQCSASNVAGVRYSKNARLKLQNGEEEIVIVEPTTPAPAPDSAHFSTPFQDVYYIGASPLTLTCAVKNADMITIRCNGRRYDREEVTSDQEYNQDTRKFDITSSIQVTPNEYMGANKKFECICTMWFTVDGRWERKESPASSKAKIEEAFIEEEFAMEPTDTRAELGESTELICSPPFGGPEPQVSWTKDGVKMDTAVDDNMEVSVSGSLIITEMRSEYEGSYTCVASNIAGTLYSQAARLEAFVPATDAITESILVDGASTAEPEIYTPGEEPEPEPTSEPGTGGVVVHRGKPMFTEQPKSIYYAVKGEPLLITCAAKNVIRITYRCSGYPVPEDRYENNNLDSGDVTSVTLQLSREEVESFTDDNTCVCDAYFYNEQGSEDVITSSRGSVNLAYIKRRFQKNPEDTRTVSGMMVALPCTPPEASPAPTVYWLNNGVRMDLTQYKQVVMPPDNSLVFISPSAQFTGDYTCVAENVAGKRMSNTARLTIDDVSGGQNPDEAFATAEPDHTHHEYHTAEPEVESEPEVTTPEPEGEPETEDHDYTTSEPEVIPESEYTSEPEAEVTAEPEYMTTESMRGNEIEGQPEPTDAHSQSADITTPSESDVESVSMVTDESVVDEDVVTSEQVDMIPMTTSSMVVVPMETDSIETDSIETDSMETESMETESMETESLGTDSMVTEAMETGKGPEMVTKGTKGPKKTEKGNKRKKNKIMKCQDKLKICGNAFETEVHSASKCTAVNNYLECTAAYMKMCVGILSDSELRSIQESTSNMAEDCKEDKDLGPYEACNELHQCTKHLTEGDSLLFNDLNSACNALTAMLMCGHSALGKCNIDNRFERTETGLSKIGEWYANYCTKIIMDRGSFVTCDAVKQCNRPLNASTSVKDMYDVDQWCPYTHRVVECTSEAVESCQPDDRAQIESDLKMLEAEALQICPRPGVQPEKPTIDAKKEPESAGSRGVPSVLTVVLSLFQVVFMLVLTVR